MGKPIIHFLYGFFFFSKHRTVGIFNSKTLICLPLFENLDVHKMKLNDDKIALISNSLLTYICTHFHIH